MACKLDTSDHHHLFPTIPRIEHSFNLRENAGNWTPHGIIS